MPSKTNTSISQQSTTEEKRPLSQERSISHPVTLATAQPRPTTSRQILQLQRTIGNRAVTRLMTNIIQRTLHVNGAEVDPVEIKSKIEDKKSVSKWLEALKTAIDSLNTSNTSAKTTQELADLIVSMANAGPVAMTVLNTTIEAHLKAKARREETARKLQEKPPKLLGRCSPERHIFPGATSSAIKEGRTTIVKAEKYAVDIEKINKALEGKENGLGDDSLTVPYAVAFVQIGYEFTVDGTNYRWQPEHGMYPIGGTDTKSDAAAEKAIKEKKWE